MIYCNGSPKMGTHFALKATRLFGGECLLASHRHDVNIDTIKNKHIHIIRNPRNAFLSYLRMQSVELSNKKIVSEIPRFITECLSYTHYLKDENTLTIRFEALLSDELELVKISKFLDAPMIDGHFDLLEGGTATYTGKNMRSNWRTIWNEEIEEAWVIWGGLVLGNLLGYNNV